MQYYIFFFSLYYLKIRIVLKSTGLGILIPCDLMINVRHEFIFFHSIAPETLRQQCSPTSSSPASLATGHLTGHLYPSSDFTGGSCNYFKLSTVQSPISASFGAAGKKTEPKKKKFFFFKFHEIFI